MKRALCWGYFLFVAAYVVVSSSFDLIASVELDQMCMRSGMLGRMWKNKHCTNAARDLENGPFALMDLVLRRLVDWRILGAVGGGVAFFSVIGAMRMPRTMTADARMKARHQLEKLKRLLVGAGARAGAGPGAGGAPLMLLQDWENTADLQHESE